MSPACKSRGGADVHEQASQESTALRRPTPRPRLARGLPGGLRRRVDAGEMQLNEPRTFGRLGRAIGDFYDSGGESAVALKE